jgi:hypothetical protein
MDSVFFLAFVVQALFSLQQRHLPLTYSVAGSIAAPASCLYGIPCNADAVLKVNVATGECTTFGGMINEKGHTVR